MIAPNKHTNIKYSVIYISGLILKVVQESGIVKYEELNSSIVRTTGVQAKEIFSYSLSFLYLLNKIYYNDKLDSIALVNK